MIQRDFHVRFPNMKRTLDTVERANIKKKYADINISWQKKKQKKFQKATKKREEN